MDGSASQLSDLSMLGARVLVMLSAYSCKSEASTASLPALRRSRSCLHIYWLGLDRFLSNYKKLSCRLRLYGAICTSASPAWRFVCKAWNDGSES